MGAVGGAVEGNFVEVEVEGVFVFGGWGAGVEL